MKIKKQTQWQFLITCRKHIDNGWTLLDLVQKLNLASRCKLFLQAYQSKFHFISQKLSGFYNLYFWTFIPNYLILDCHKTVSLWIQVSWDMSIKPSVTNSFRQNVFSFQWIKPGLLFQETCVELFNQISDSQLSSSAFYPQKPCVLCKLPGSTEILLILPFMVKPWPRGSFLT